MATAVKAPLARREPAAIATGVVTLLATFMYVAPSMGIGIPDTVAKVITLVLTLAAGLGIRSVVTPVIKAPARVTIETPEDDPPTVAHTTAASKDRVAAKPTAKDKIDQVADEAKRKLGH